MFLLLSVLTAALVFAAIDLFPSSKVSLISPNSTFKNISGLITLNATMNDSRSNITNVTFRFIQTNASLYNATIFSDANNDTIFDNTSFNSSLVPDGLYNISLIAYNATNNDTGAFLLNSTIMGVIVDNTAPNVTMNTTSFNTTNTIPNFTMFMKDTIALTSNCALLFNGVSYNTTNITSGTSNVIKVNASGLSDGSYSVIASCTDWAGNNGNSTGNTSIINLSVDNAAPRITSASVGSLTTTAGTLTVVADDAVTGVSLCNVTGPVSPTSLTRSGSTTTYTLGLASLNEGITYSANVSCSDFNGFTNSTIVSFTTAVTAASSSSSSSSGGSGGSSSSAVTSGVTGQFQKQFWATAAAGEKNTLVVSKGDIGVTEVAFELSVMTYGVSMQVKKVESAPADAPKITSKVFQLVEITQVNVAKSLSGTAGITFKVPVSWLTTNNVDASNVALLRYHDGKWVALPTVVGEKSGDFVSFTAQTPGFSFFAISGTPGAASTPAPVAPVASTPAPVAPVASAPAPAAPVASAPAAEVTSTPVTSDDSSNGFPMWAIVILVILGVVVIVVIVKTIRAKPVQKSWNKK